MSETVKIALSQLVLWYNAPRIQSWPAFLGHIPEDVTYPSATEFGRRYFTERMTDDRHSAAEKITRNLPGLERKSQGFLLRGVGLLEKGKNGYRLSGDAKELVSLYRGAPRGKEWVRKLAELLLTREPRSRLLIRLLSERDAELEFRGKGWFLGSLRQAVLRSPGKPDFFPFDDRKGNADCLRGLLQEKAWWALGQWRDHNLLEHASDCEFAGQLTENFSMHDIGLALHAASEVFLHIGLLKSEGSICVLGEAAGAEEFSAEISSDFGWQTISGKVETLEEVLEDMLPKLQADTGFVVASELREALIKKGIANPDREIAQLEREGRIVISAEDYGQSRHGVGLYGDPRKQLIKLRVVAGGL